jgi:hypothetical protein
MCAIRWKLILVGSALVGWMCSVTVLAATAIRLHNVTSESGVQFKHTDASDGKYYLHEAMSAGLALFDYDLDGDIDIYFLNGGLPPGNRSDDPPRNGLFRNDGKWKFTDVTLQAGVGDTGHGLGVAVGDYDNDGDPDLYVTNFGPNVLYRNNGDGTFTDVTRIAGVGNGSRFGAGTSFLDMDADGDLDLFVANYIKFNYDQHVPRRRQGFPVYGSPADYAFDPNTLYRNNGDSTFSDASAEAGIAAVAAPGMGIVCADYDEDGDTDVLVANDGQANSLFQNDGHGLFQEVGLVSGFAYDMAGKVHASMGVDCGDFDNDGHLDFHVTSFQGELATLYKNAGSGQIEDVTNSSGAGAGTRAPVTWGNGFADFDNDGDLDIFIACGHLDDQLHRFDQSSTYEAANVVLENIGRGKFANVSDQCGEGLNVKLSSRGAGFDDMDNDGDIDVVVLNSRREPTLLRNDTQAGNHWIDLRIEGTRCNRDGVGSRVEIDSDHLRHVAEVHSGRGYQSHFGSRLHFGLGKRTRINQLRVKWHGGGIDSLEDIPVNQRMTIRQISHHGSEGRQSE